MLTLAWVACTPGAPEFTTDDTTLITLVPGDATIDVGQQLAYTVELTKKGVTTNADPALFNWISSGPTVATVDDHGVALGLKPGSTRIQAQSKSQPSNGAGVNLNVVAAPPVAMLAAMPGAMTVRLSGSDREVTYVADPSHHLLRTIFTERNGAVSQRDAFVPAIEGRTWLAIDPSSRMLCVLSRDLHQVAALPFDLVTGEVDAGKVERYAVDVDVFAIATGPNGSLVLHHLYGRDTQLAPSY